MAWDAFVREVIEKRLRIEGPIGGYWYAAREGAKDAVLFRTPADENIFWAYRQVCTQDDVAGGTLQAEITPAAGTSLRLVGASIQASGNRATGWYVLESGGTDTYFQLATGAAVAAGKLSIPAICSTAATAGNTIDQQALERDGIPEDVKLVGTVVSAAQTETATLRVLAIIEGAFTRPTVSWAASGGTPNAAAAVTDTLRRVPVVR